MNWLPWVAAGTCLLFNKALRPLANWSRRAMIPLSFGLLLALGILYSSTLETYQQALGHLLARDSQAQLVEAVPQYVAENTLPTETVLVWGGQAGINFLAQRVSPTPYFSYPSFVPCAITDQMSDQFFRSVRLHPPVLIVDPSAVIGVGELVPLSAMKPLQWSTSHAMYAPPYLDEFFTFFHDNYSFETTVSGMVIYRLRR